MTLHLYILFLYFCLVTCGSAYGNSDHDINTEYISLVDKIDDYLTPQKKKSNDDSFNILTTTTVSSLLETNDDDETQEQKPFSTSSQTENEKIPHVLLRWPHLRRQIFKSRHVWDRLLSSQFLKQYLMNSDVDRKPQIPLDLEAREIELQDLEDNGGSSTFNSWDSQNSILGYRRNIFTFWDDPICDVFVFPSGIYVCGDARVRGTVTVVSGMNLSGVIDKYSAQTSFSTGYYKADHVHRRCTIDPSEKLEKNVPWCFLNLIVRSADIVVQNSVQITGSLYMKAGRVDAGAELLVGLRGFVYANERIVGFRPSRYAEEYANYESEIQKRRRTLTKETMGHEFQNFYTMNRRAWREDRKEPSRAATRKERRFDTTLSDSMLDDRENNNNNNDDDDTLIEELTQYKVRERITFKEYLDIEARRSRMFHNFSNPDKATYRRSKVFENYPENKDVNYKDLTFTSNNTEANRFLYLVSPPFEKIFLVQREVETLKCPIIDTSGAMLLLQRAANGTFERRTTFPSHKYGYGFTSPASDSVRLPQTTSSFMSSTITRMPFGPNRPLSLTASQVSEFNPNVPYSGRLPRLEYNTTLGDIVVLTTMTVSSSAFVWTFGNFIGTGVFLNDGADMHLHCGQFFTNITDPLGITVAKASVASSGGLLESISSRLAVQGSSSVILAGSAVITKYLQVFRKSNVRIIGDLLTAVASINEASNLLVVSTVEVEMLLDVSDSSELTLRGSLALGIFQVVDGSSASIYAPPPHHIYSKQNNTFDKSQNKKQIRTVVAIEDSLVVDGSSHITFHDTSLLIQNSMHISNSSSIKIYNGDLFLQGEGSLRIIASRFILGGNCIAPRGSLLIGLGSKTIVQGSLRVAGFTALEAIQEAEKLAERRKQKLNMIIAQYGHNNNRSEHWEISEEFKKLNQTYPYNSVDIASCSLSQRLNNNTKNISLSESIFLDTFENNESLLNSSTTYNNCFFVNKTYDALQHNNETLEQLINNTVKEIAPKPRPALFVETSQLFVGESIEILNSWVDISKGSQVFVGFGIFSRHSNSTLLTIRLNSIIHVIKGSVLPGISLTVTGGSRLYVNNGTIFVGGTIEIKDGGFVQSQMIRANDDVSVSTQGELHTAYELITNGSLLVVSSRGKVSCKEIRQKKGDIFVEDGGSVYALNGNIWVYGSIVAQDWGTVHVPRGNIVAVKGDVVAENHSHIHVGGAIILYSTHLHHVANNKLSLAQQQQQRQEFSDDVVKTTESIALKLNDTFSSLNTEIMNENEEKFQNRTIYSTSMAMDGKQLLHESFRHSIMSQLDSYKEKFLPSSFVRRTPESSISVMRVVPRSIGIEVYLQNVPDTMPNKTKDKEINTSGETPLDSKIAENFDDNFKETPEKLKQSLETKIEVAHELQQPTEWDALLVSRESFHYPAVEIMMAQQQRQT